MITTFLRPSSADEAVFMQVTTPDALFLAGGTYLLSSAFHAKPGAVISIDGLFSRSIERTAEVLSIGAQATLQELVESERIPAVLRDSARGLGSRNVRNRATIAGNIAAKLFCSCLNPALLVLDARLRLSNGPTVTIDDYLSSRTSLIETVEIPLPPTRRAAYRRWARTEGDYSAVAAAVSFEASGSALKGVRIAAVGAGPAVRRLPEVERLFEGHSLPGRAEIEEAVGPLLTTYGDVRAGAPYKRLRLSQLIADALVAARDSDGEAAL